MMNPDATLQHILRSGIVATLPADLPLQSITKVSDALLAAPVLSVTVPWNTAAPTLIQEIYQRGGNNIIVGVSGVDTAVQLEDILAGPAQFIISSRFESSFFDSCQSAGRLYIPTVITIMAANAAYQAGVRLINMRTGGPQGAQFVEVVRQAIPQLRIAVGGNFSLEEASQYAKSGASAMMVQDTIYQDDDQLMADIIQKARQLQQHWDQGTNERQAAKNNQSPGSQNPSLN